MFSIELKKYVENGRLLDSRQCALTIRSRVADALEEGEEVVLDFSEARPTKAFVDELVGSLVRAEGKSILTHLIMKSCNADTKALVRSVVSNCLQQHTQSKLSEMLSPQTLTTDSSSKRKAPHTRSSLVD